MKLKNANILITGGASGIGRIMGRMALERGANHLIVWDINAANIEATVAELSALGKVAGYVVDVANNTLVKQTYRQVCEECGKVDILINCAGIITSNKTFDQLTEEDLAYIGRFATTAASLSTETLGGIPSIPTPETVLRRI